MTSVDAEIVDALRTRHPGGYPVASAGSIADAEAALGAKFPRLLARIYTEVADGGFGPAGGLLGLAGGHPDIDGRSAVELYKWLRKQGGWREHLLPAFDWGDASWSCVDLSTPTGVMVTADEAGFTATRFDVGTWFAEWLAGTDLHDEIYEVGEATIVDPFTRKPRVIRRRERAKGKLIEATSQG